MDADLKEQLAAQWKNQFKVVLQLSSLAAVKEHTKCYDPNTDALGYYKLKKLFAEKSKEFRFEQKYELSNGPDELMKFVLDTVDAFKRHVEKGNLWEELWIEGKPKKERAAQLIYYAMADCFRVEFHAIRDGGFSFFFSRKRDVVSSPIA